MEKDIIIITKEKKKILVKKEDILEFCYGKEFAKKLKSGKKDL